MMVPTGGPKDEPVEGRSIAHRRRGDGQPLHRPGSAFVGRITTAAVTTSPRRKVNEWLEGGDFVTAVHWMKVMHSNAFSRQHGTHHVPGHVGQAEVSAVVAVGQLGVVQANQVQDRGVQVVDAHAVGHGLEADVVGRAVGHAAADACPGHPHGEGVGGRVVPSLGDRDQFRFVGAGTSGRNQGRGEAGKGQGETRSVLCGHTHGDNPFDFVGQTQRA